MFSSTNQDDISNLTGLLLARFTNQGSGVTVRRQIDPSLNTLFEVESLVQVRRRGFSLWPHRIPSSTQMIEAGFFNCNIGDRVMCIYCNLICQQWISTTDNPCEVHKTFSPNCIYVKAKLIRPPTSSILIVNENGASATPSNPSSSPSNLEPSWSHEIALTAACNPAFAELLKRHATFATWPQENLPPIDDLVRAGFFYVGDKTIVTCFYCNGSLQNWGPKDKPMIEHARWFPHCAYAKQLCGDELYRRIQETKRAQQEHMRANEANATGTKNNNRPATTSRQLSAPDERTIDRMVAARLELAVSKRLLKKFKLSIVKRCWEDQLRLKRDDFVSDIDLCIACVILQKQIEHSKGKKENIVIPSIRMKQIREQNEIQARQRLTVSNRITTDTQKMSINKLLQSLEAHLMNIRDYLNLPVLNPTYRRISTLLTASRSNTLLDTLGIKGVQRRTFSHSSLVSNISSVSMVDAGFFYCNTFDRVICLCCNLICEGWTVGVDDPFQVHRTVSPYCPYVQNKLAPSPDKPLPIINESTIQQTSNNCSSTGDRLDLSEFPQIVHVAAKNSLYYDLIKRQASFATWSAANLSTPGDLARAGFFYTGKGTTVRCFYCDGTLHNWGSDDNYIGEHVRRFPYCAYARQVCGDEMYQQIQTAERKRKEKDKTNETHTHCLQVSIPDDNTLIRLVWKRLHLPISRCLLNNNFKFSIIKRCWEDQLRLKKCDFHSDDDVFIACLILQKQTEHINGDRNNIVVPSQRMQQMQEQRIQDTNNGMNATNQRLEPVRSTAAPSAHGEQSSATQFNPCFICMVAPKRSACIPCGHIVACTSCDQSLRICPICRRDIETFVRI